MEQQEKCHSTAGSEVGAGEWWPVSDKAASWPGVPGFFFCYNVQRLVLGDGFSPSLAMLSESSGSVTQTPSPSPFLHSWSFCYLPKADTGHASGLQDRWRLQLVCYCVSFSPLPSAPGLNVQRILKRRELNLKLIGWEQIPASLSSSDGKPYLPQLESEVGRRRIP